jgi:hypothetical protein
MLASCYVPRFIVTDKLGSYSSAKREILQGVEHRQSRYSNNRCEVSRQPTQRRERHMRRFRSVRQAQQFLTTHTPIHNHFQLHRNHLSASGTAPPASALSILGTMRLVSCSHAKLEGSRRLCRPLGVQVDSTKSFVVMKVSIINGIANSRVLTASFNLIRYTVIHASALSRLDHRRNPLSDFGQIEPVRKSSSNQID